MLPTVHKVTIGSAAGLAIIFAIYSAVHQNWIMTGASVVIAGAALLYLRWFIKKNA